MQVFGIKAFGKPIVDLGQHLVSFFLFALLLPQAREARVGTQLQRLCLLPARDFNSLVKTRFGFRLRLGARCRVSRHRGQNFKSDKSHDIVGIL